MLLGEREHGFIKDNVTRDDELVGREIKTPITFMRERIFEKGARSGSRIQIVRGGGCEIGVAKAPKNP